MSSRIIVLSLVLLAGCAGTQRSISPDQMVESKKSPRLLVGISEFGTPVLAASHYDAMSGLATTSSELNLPDRKGAGNDMTCRREMVTGSHVPHWMCRYNDDTRVSREQLQNWLDQPRLWIQTRAPGASMSIGHGPGAAIPGPAAP